MAAHCSQPEALTASTAALTFLTGGAACIR